MEVPILAANMDTIIGLKLAEVLVRAGSVPILHRFYKDHRELQDLITALEGHCFISCGVDDLSMVEKILMGAAYPIHGICIDIAHGHSVAMERTIRTLKGDFGGLQIIAGNVCTAQAFHDLVNWGANAVKVGIGAGEVCTTRKVTPFGVPQFTAIQDCAKISREMQVPMIADGGIRSSRDITLALAAGASSVMIGGLFARTNEAAGNGWYRGQASADFQREFFGIVKEGTVAEGVAKYIKPEMAAEVMINELLAGVRSGMTYGGARTIGELQKKAEFMATTGRYANGAS